MVATYNTSSPNNVPLSLAFNHRLIIHVVICTLIYVKRQLINSILKSSFSDWSMEDTETFYIRKQLCSMHLLRYLEYVFKNTYITIITYSVILSLLICDHFLLFL